MSHSSRLRSEFFPARSAIDAAHRAIAGRVPHASVSVHDGLISPDGYSSGLRERVRFGAEAPREMGRRCHAAPGRALDGR